MAEFTHFNEAGRARMVDVTGKADTQREAVARGRITMQPATLTRILQGEMTKGDVLGVAQVAGIMGAKQTSQLIPMCHPLFLTGVDLTFWPDLSNNCINIEAKVRTTGKTGVEMEALTAVAVAALAIYDMCKAVDKGMTIENVRLVEKTGGKSGTFRREGEDEWARS
ncbi:MAG: cyclic pyranopterin monophosphate synthase MoaC [Firmicutes bacterium]|nr:cyclic pyranopterin monophosphate synthase MoaC [Bacillota bacterium]